MKRTHHCNELRPAHIGQTVTLGRLGPFPPRPGRAHLHRRPRPRRPHPDRLRPVRSAEGTVRAAPPRCAANASSASPAKSASVPTGTNNPKIPTGEVEVMAQALEVLNMAEVLPFPVDDPEVASKVNEELRLKYRYLDLRRPEMARNLRLRSKVATATRVFMDEQGFLEVETPILFKIHAGRRARVSRAEPPRAGHVLRAAAIAAAVQADPHGRAASSAITSSPAASATRTSAPTASSSSPRSTSRCRFIEREDIYALIEGLLKRVWKTALEHGHPDAVQAHHVPGSAEPLRHRQARHALRHGAGGFHRGISRAARSRCSAARSPTAAW